MNLECLRTIISIIGRQQKVHYMWAEHLDALRTVLTEIKFTDADSSAMAVEDGFSAWVKATVGLSSDRAIHFVGNGASASMASHFAADITKNCGIRADVFTDAALLTALGNDNGFENCFAVALERYGLRGDMLIAVSSSGASQNIINACRMARQRGIFVVTVTAKCPDNPVRQLGQINIHVPAANFSLAESAHTVILHHWTDRLEKIHQAASPSLECDSQS